MMESFSEKPMWTADSQDYERVSSMFATMALILGGVGVLGAFIMSGLALIQLVDGGGFSPLIAAIALGFQSIMLIVFGSMMHLLSKVLLAVFDLSLSDARQRMYADETTPTSEVE